MVVIPGNPKPQPKQKWAGDARSPIGLWRIKTAQAAKRAMKRAKAFIQQGALRVSCVFIFPRPKGKQKKTMLMPRIVHEGTPDLTNLMKAIEDACKGIVFKDDKQIVRYRKIEKYTAECVWNAREQIFEEENARAILVFQSTTTVCKKSLQRVTRRTEECLTRTPRRK